MYLIIKGRDITISDKVLKNGCWVGRHVVDK